MMKGTLYLMPALLGGDNYKSCIPEIAWDFLKNIKYFIVEDIRTARRFLKYGGFLQSFDEVTFFLIDKHTDPNVFPSYLNPAEQGHDIALLSEAGCPCVADPGALIVINAHQRDIEVKPLVGPSSILLALMASGLNGQNFSFLGYLPFKPYERKKKIKELEILAKKNFQTQIFIETPYRNQSLLVDILNAAFPDTQLCIACNLTLADEFVKTKQISEWKKKMPDINKKQTVFLLAC